jgi:hypothetical protein
VTIEDITTAVELPDAVAAWRESWARVFVHAKDADCRDILRKAAAEGWRVLAINKSVYPDSHAVAHQAVVDALARWANIAGIADDDAQAIIAGAKDRAGDGHGDGAADAAADDDADGRAPEFSDEAVALQFAERYAGRLCYANPWSKWLVWTGAKWATDDTLRACDLARRLCREIARQCETG